MISDAVNLYFSVDRVQKKETVLFSFRDSKMFIGFEVKYRTSRILVILVILSYISSNNIFCNNVWTSNALSSIETCIMVSGLRRVWFTRDTRRYINVFWLHYKIDGLILANRWHKSTWHHLTDSYLHASSFFSDRGVTARTGHFMEGGLVSAELSLPANRPLDSGPSCRNHDQMPRSAVNEDVRQSAFLSHNAYIYSRQCCTAVVYNCLSVCHSVCLTHTGILSKRLKNPITLTSATT